MKEENAKIVKKKNKRGIDVVDGEKGCGKLEGNVKLENGKGLSNGGVKKFRAMVVAPTNATTYSKKSDFKETFSCRSLPLGRN
ncbi:hypothetical protein REPUB_Repub03eG0023900 [Reevesia pubescens]